MSARLDALRRQFNDIKSGINAIEAKATQEKRDLTDVEQADVDKLLARADDLTPQIEEEAKRQERLTAAGEVLARTRPAPAPAPAPAQRSETGPSLSLGEYCSLVVRSKQGDGEATELLTRTVASQSTADTAGIIPVPIVGPVLDLFDASRPVFASFTSRPMPQYGKTFSRPMITQHTLAGQQAAELDELASRKMTITGNTVTKLTLGGVLELTEQDVDWTDPAVLDIVIQDFLKQYTRLTETKAVAALNTLAAATSDYDDTSIATIIHSFITAIGAVDTAAEEMPDTCWLAKDAMLALASTTNSTTNVSALTLLRQALADAGIPLKFVPARGLASGKKIIGCSSLVESYEQRKGLLSAPDVSRLGVYIAHRGYAAFFGVAAGFVSLVDS